MKVSPKKDDGNFDVKIFDGSILVHVLPRTTITTFQQYAEQVFVPFLRRELQTVNRVDVVWDSYLDSSIKGATRKKRGAGLRRKVNPQAKIPLRWNDFLRDPSNKIELFSLLTNTAARQKVADKKDLYITSDESVISIGNASSMPNCITKKQTQVHLLHSVQRGNKKILVKTVDNGVIIILLGKLEEISDLWIAFGVCKDFALYSIDDIYEEIGANTTQALLVFFSFSGCDTTSSFHGKGKRSFGSFPVVTSAFLFIAENPFKAVDIISPHFMTLEPFTVILYHKTSDCQYLNESRKELFCKKTRSLKNLPPTQDALAHHVKRTIFRAVYGHCHQTLKA